MALDEAIALRIYEGCGATPLTLSICSTLYGCTDLVVPDIVPRHEIPIPRVLIFCSAVVQVVNGRIAIRTHINRWQLPKRVTIVSQLYAKRCTESAKLGLSSLVFLRQLTKDATYFCSCFGTRASARRVAIFFDCVGIVSDEFRRSKAECTIKGKRIIDVALAHQLCSITAVSQAAVQRSREFRYISQNTVLILDQTHSAASSRSSPAGGILWPSRRSTSAAHSTTLLPGP